MAAATAAPPSANQYSRTPRTKNIDRKISSRIEALPRSEETTTIRPNRMTKWPAICTTDMKELISWYSFSQVMCFAETTI